MLQHHRHVLSCFYDFWTSQTPQSVMREVMDCEGMSSNIPRFPKHTIKSAKFNPFFKSTKPTFSTFSYPNQRILDTLGQCWQHNAALTSPSPPDHLMTSHDGCLCISWQCNTRRWPRLATDWSCLSPVQASPSPGPADTAGSPGHGYSSRAIIAVTSETTHTNTA